MMPNKRSSSIALKSRAWFLLPALAGALVACPPAPTPPAPVQIGVQSASNTIQALVGQSIQFSATGATNLTWKVNNIVGGNTSIGTISDGGRFTAPASVPNPAIVTVRAESKVNPADFGEAQIIVIDSNGPGGIQGTVTLPAGLLGTGLLGANVQAKASIPVAKPIKTDWSLPHVAGQILVVGGDSSQLSAKGLRVQSLGSNISSLKVPTGSSEQAFAERIAAETGAQVQPNYIYRPLGTIAPNDPYFQTSNSDTQYHMPTIDIAGAWAVQTDGAMVAVLDSGANFNHPDLQGRLVKGKDFCVDATNGCKDPPDLDPSDFKTDDGTGGHGTHTAGIVGAIANNGVGIAGIMQAGPILIEKVLGPGQSTCDNGTQQVPCSVASGTSASVAAGIRDAISRGAKVINMSLGIVPQKSSLFDPDGAVSQAIAAADQADIVVVVAAGNRVGNSVGVNYPANLPTVLAVGLVNNDGSASEFSETGPEMDLVAPGLLAIGKDAQGKTLYKGVISTDIIGSSGYSYRGGTSEAAPQVAAIAGLMRAKNPNLSALQTRTILKATARNLGDKNLFGSGMLQAGAALREAAKNAPAPSTRTTILIFADRLLDSGKYDNGSDSRSAKIQVELEGTSGSSQYRIELGQNKLKLTPGTYRIAACVEKNDPTQICNSGDLTATQLGVVYSGQALSGINLTLQ
jgi:subtilisin family serine protease